MTFRIDPALVKFNAAGTAQFEGDAKAARDLLQGLAISLKSGSGVKSGYLSLAPASGGAGQVEVGLRRWRGANASTDQATTLVKELVSKAYGDQPAVQQAMESYLQKSSNRIGTQSFARLVQSLSTEHSQVSGESQPAQSAQLNGLQVRRSARLDTEGFEASFKTRHTLDQASAGVKQAITSASAQADPVGALAALERQYEVLGRAIDQATSAGMNLDDLQESLRQLNAQMEQFHSRAAQVQALAREAEALQPPIEPKRASAEVLHERDDEVGSQQDAPQGGLGSSGLGPQLELPQQEIRRQEKSSIEIEVPERSDPVLKRAQMLAKIDQARSLVDLSLSAKEQIELKKALSSGDFDEAKRVMTKHKMVEGFLFQSQPGDIARDLVNNYYGGKALSTRLVPFANRLWHSTFYLSEVSKKGKLESSKRSGASVVAEFLLAAYNIPSPAGKDVDLAQLKPLANALRLWEAQVSSKRSRELADEIITQLCPQWVDRETNMKLKSLLSPLSNEIHLDLEDYKTKDEEDEWVRIAQVKVAGGGSDLLTVVSPDDGSSSTARVRQELVARIQNETGVKLTASFVLFGLKNAENSVIVDPKGDLRNASLLNCEIRGHTKEVDFSDANLTGSTITLSALYWENDRPVRLNTADFTNASLDNSDVTINYSYLQEFTRSLTTEQKQEATLRIMNAQREGKQIGPLYTINSVADRYTLLKQKLMREALEVSASAGVVGQLSKDWVEVLKQNPFYLEDPEIRRLAEPLLGREKWLRKSEQVR